MMSGARGSIEAIAIKNLQEVLRSKGISAEALFAKYDLDGDGTLSEHEFATALESITGQQAPATIIGAVFGAIDSNSDGSVDWDEFTNFMLLENQAAADMSDRSYSERLTEDDPNGDPNPKHLHHRDMMDGILHLTKQEKLVTNSRDGTVRVWSAANFSHIKTVRVSRDSWLTNTCHFEQSNRVAVSSIDRSVSFYDASTFELTGQLWGLDTSPLCLGCWNDQSKEKMIVGDDCGHISL